MVTWAAQERGWLRLNWMLHFRGAARMAWRTKDNEFVFRRGQSLFNSLAFARNLEFRPAGVSGRRKAGTCPRTCQ